MAVLETDIVSVRDCVVDAVVVALDVIEDISVALTLEDADTDHVVVLVLVPVVVAVDDREELNVFEPVDVAVEVADVAVSDTVVVSELVCVELSVTEPVELRVDSCSTHTHTHTCTHSYEYMATHTHTQRERYITSDGIYTFT